MTVQTHGLLINGNFISKNGGLRKDAALIDLGVLEDFLHFVLEPAAILRYGFRGLCLHLGRQRLNSSGAGENIGRELGALPLPHAVEVLQSHIQYGTDIRRDGLHVLGGLLHKKHVLKPRQQGQGNVVPEPIGVSKLCKRGIIAVGHRPVQADDHSVRLGAVDGDENIYLPPGNTALDGAFNRILRKHIGTRHLDGTIQVTVVDGTDLHCNGSVVQNRLSPAIAGHTADHRRSPLSSFVLICRSPIAQRFVHPGDIKGN